MTSEISKLNVKIFGDGADMATILDLYSKTWICGFTTNPTLMRKAGIQNYEAFARELIEKVPDRPISLKFLPTTSLKWSGRRTSSPPGRTTFTSRFRSRIRAVSRRSIWSPPLAFRCQSECNRTPHP